MAPLKAPAEKLPLTVRKNLRDVWEAKRPEYEASMQKVLGESWKIDVNPNLIYSYADDDRKPRLGDVLTWYFEAFVYNLEKFTEAFGSDGVQELNTLCSKHQVVFAPQETTDFRYGGLVIADGQLRLVFAEDCLATNVDDVSSDFPTALKNASSAAGGNNALNLVARNGIKLDYEPKAEKTRAAIATLVNMPSLTLNPNFEANAEVLAKSPKQVEDGWDRQIGRATIAYFESLEYILDREKFKDDEMQQEAFQEAVEMGQVCVRILPKWEDGESRYGMVKIDEGVLYILATVDTWGVNVDDAARGLLDIL